MKRVIDAALALGYLVSAYTVIVAVLWLEGVLLNY